jgi:hypothetical protein
MGGTQKQEQTWCYVLTSLASHLGVAGQVSTQSTCVDPRLQWSQARNVWHNAAVRTFFYMLATPIRRIKRR